MAAITISREYGSRGAAIGARVGKRLGWRYVDDGLIFLVAYRAGIPVENVRAYDQEAFSHLRALIHNCLAMLEGPGPPVLGQTVGRPDEIEMPQELQRFNSSRYLRLVRQLILALAASGRVVIMGRGPRCSCGASPGCFTSGPWRRSASAWPGWPRTRRSIAGKPPVEAGRETAPWRGICGTSTGWTGRTHSCTISC